MSILLGGHRVESAFDGMNYPITVGRGLYGFWVHRRKQTWYFKTRFERDSFHNSLNVMQIYTVAHADQIIGSWNRARDIYDAGPYFSNYASNSMQDTFDRDRDQTISKLYEHERLIEQKCGRTATIVYT